MAKAAAETVAVRAGAAARHAAGAGRAAGGLRGRHPLSGPHRPDDGGARSRHRRLPACSPAPRPARRRCCGAATSLQHGKARALVVNSGNANAFTGKKGDEADAHHRRGCGQGGRVRADEVFMASTGVIGEPLDAGKFAHLLDGLARSAAADAFEIGGARDHDHRHLSQARDAHGRDRRCPPSPSTASARAPA